MSNAASDKPAPLVTAAALAAGTEYPFKHPLNPRSEIHFRGIDGQSMSERAGLRRLSVYTARIPPGAESFVYHSHHHEEEWLYVLAGRGAIVIGEVEHAIGPGDFAGFAPGGPAHLVKNPSDGDLVLLMGGERREMELADIPHLGKRLLRSNGKMWLLDETGMTPFMAEE